jgi:hypothetical protein
MKSPLSFDIMAQSYLSFFYKKTFLRFFFEQGSVGFNFRLRCMNDERMFVPV